MKAYIKLDQNAIDCIKGTYGQNNYVDIMGIIIETVTKALKDEPAPEIFVIITDEKFRAEDH